MSSKSHEFAAYVPALILRHFRHSSVPPTQAEGDRLPAVAMFADIAGSTKITNELSRLGRLHGPEEMYRILNAYYQPLVSQINARGGDVIGFAGDAVLAVWTAEGSDLGPALRQATQAGIEIQRDLNNMELAPDVRLTLRICLGLGELSTALVGGRLGFWQLVASGPPLDQIRAAGSVVRIGEVFLSREACDILGPATLERQPDGGAFVRQIPNPPPPPNPAVLPNVAALPEQSLRPFVQRAVQESIDAGLADYMDQSRTVSVLFVRLCRPAGEPPSWQRVQDAMSLVQDAAARYEGTVAQFIEDDKGLITLMAFGLPMVGHEDDPRRAVEAAAFLQDPVNSRGLSCAIGASTGLPFCGALGSPGRRVVYTVTGADVVRAARLMQLAKNGEILCDEDTHTAARKTTSLRFARLPRFTLKGYDTPARVFRVLTGKAPQRHVGIGRERERELVLAALDEAAAGRSRVIWLEGEDGAGAATLVDELVEKAAGRVKQLGVPDRAADPPKSPWVAVWTDLLGLRAVRDLVRRQHRIASFFADRPGLAPLLNDLFGTSLPETSETRAISPADRDAARDNLLFVLVDELSRTRPVLVILEGTHRLDPASRALAGRLAGLGSCVTVVMTAEPIAGPHELRDHPGTLLVPLPPLSDETTALLVCARLRADRLGEQFAALLRERARGNPASVERECDRLLAEDQIIVDHGICELAEAALNSKSTDGIVTIPLIGRSAERAVVDAALGAVFGGQNRVVLVEGDTGSGKSRMLEETWQMAEDRAMLVLVGHCSSVEAATPYYPWRAVCNELLGLSGLAAPTERGALVLAALVHSPEHLAFASLLNDLLGLALPEDEVIQQMVGQNRADNLTAVLAGLIRAAADGRPTLVMLEDAHWADSASWRLAKVVLERLNRVAIVMSVGRMVTAAPAEYEFFTAAPDTDRIALDALSEAGTREFAQAHFGADRVADSLAGLVWRRTQGNPLFIVQMAGHLVDSRFVVVEQGTASLHAHAGNAIEPAIPDTIRGLVAAQVDRLPPRQQLTAKVSSVIGPLFPSRALAAIYPDSATTAALTEHMVTLTRERLLRQDRLEPDTVYEFPHPILQQVCYELLTRPQRQRLHQSAAEWFQADRFGSGSSQFRLIAHHWGRAGVPDREAEFLIQAGDAAMRDGAFREAITGFTEVMRSSRERFGENASAQEVAGRAHWEYQLGQASFGVGELPVAVEHLRASLKLRKRTCRTSTTGLVVDTLAQVVHQVARRLFPNRRPLAGSGDAETRETVAAYLRVGRISYYMNAMLPGTNAVLRALNLAETRGPSPELAMSYASAMILTGVLHWHRAARAYARLAERIAREVGNLHNQSVVFSYLCIYHLGQGHWERVETLALESLELAERLGDHHQCCEASTALAMVSCFLADYAGARRWTARMLDATKRSGNTMQTAWATNIEGECCFRLGQLEEAVVRLKESGAALHGNKDLTEEIRIQGMLAGLAARRGDWAAAREHADAEAIARPPSAMACSTLEGLAGVAEARFGMVDAHPQDRQARNGAQEALAALKKYSKLYPIGRPRTAVYEGRMHWLAGSPTKAFRVWQAVLEQVPRLKMPYEEALLHDTLGRHMSPDSPGRREHLEAAIRGYEQLGMVFEVERLRAAM